MKKLILTIILFIIYSALQAQSHHFELTKTSPYFSNGATNQVAYIDLGDIHIWGWVEITLTGSYSYQNTLGKYTKKYLIGKNPGNGYFYQSSEVSSAFGPVADQWKLGDMQKRSTDNHLIIPIYHLVSTGNNIVVNIKGVSLTSFDKNLFTITTPTTIENSKTRDYVSFDKLGIGTTNPSEKLHVNGNIKVGDRMNIEKMTESPSAGAIRFGDHTGWKFHFKRDSGINAGQELMTIVSGSGRVGIGTINPDSKLSVNGKIHAKEVKVSLDGWSDFVFEEKYKLPTLQDVENHIKEKGYLKDIPSTKEVKKNGIFLGEMDAKLLQKIEELTLYTIQQQKEIDFLKNEKEELKSINAKFFEMQKRLEKLEKK